MPMLVADCPRCTTASITFDVTAAVFTTRDYNWRNWYETFCVCRNCLKSSIQIVRMKEVNEALTRQPNKIMDYNVTLNGPFEVVRHLSLRDESHTHPPEHLPTNIQAIFEEGAACVAIGCNNAAATMFRLCLDLATKPLLPDPADTSVTQPNSKQRRDLGLRLQWLFDNARLPEALRELARCIREDANDGAHTGTLTESEAADILDFAEVLLERLFTEPEKLRLAELRRQQRRLPP